MRLFCAMLLVAFYTASIATQNTQTTNFNSTFDQLEQLKLVLWQAKLLPTPDDEQNSENYFFGTSLDIDNDYAVIAATGSQLSNVEGGVYIFKFINGQWEKQQFISPPDNGLSGSFGSAVAISGDTVLIGSYNAKVNSINSAGSAFVYKYNGSIWSATQTLTASDANSYDYFGHSVSILDNTIMIGAPKNNVSGSDTGAVYVFNYNGTTWNESQMLLGSGIRKDENFGYSMALKQNKVLIGAPYNNFDGINYPQSGAVYDFEFDGQNWVESQKIFPSDPQTGGRFGWSVDFDGDQAIFGAKGGNPVIGSAYIFKYDGLEWLEIKKLTVLESTFNDYFGSTVLINQDQVLVSAPSRSDNGYESGVLYSFEYDGVDWHEKNKIKPGTKTQRFGHDLAHSGSQVLIGAPYDDDNGEYSGSVFYLQLENQIWQEQGKLLPEGNAALDEYGIDVGISGMHAVVGAHKDNDNDSKSGSIYFYTLHGQNWQFTQKITASDGSNDDQFGYAVDIEGNWAVIGAPYSKRGGLRKGAVYIYHFNGINWVENQLLASGYKHFGFDISINGDKMLIGAPETIEIGSDKAGSVFIYENINSVWVETDHLLAPIGNQSEWFGSSVSLSDTWALIGSPSDNTNGYRAGAAQLYHLINGIWVEDIKIFPADPAENDYFGDDVAIDNNKIVIGAHRKQFTNYSRLGVVYAYNFDGNQWQQQQKIMPSDLTDNKYFGSAVALKGEMLMIGAQRDGELANGSGAAYQFSLSNDQWVESNKIFAPDAAQGDQFGYALDISSADKLIVSAIHDDDHGPQSGAVHIYQLNVGDLIYQNSFEPNQ